MPRLILLRASLIQKTPRQGRFSWATLFTALGSLAFLLSWLVPNHYPPWVSFHGESLMFAALLAFATRQLFVGKSAAPDWAEVVIVVLIAIIWTQWGTGLIAYHGDALVSTLYLTGFGIAWWLGTTMVRDDGHGRGLAWMAMLLVVAAALSVYLATLQWLGTANEVFGVLVAEREPWGRPFANLAQPNHLATLLLMALTMTMLLLQRGYLKRWQAVLLAVWLSFGLTMAESRAGWLSAFVLGSFALWYMRRNGGVGGTRVVIAWWSALLAMAMAWQPLNQAMLLSATRPVATIVQDSGRLHMWRQMVAGIEQSPWWGYGWRQTVVGQKAGAAVVPNGQLTDYAHSLVLDLTLWLGIPLALLLMLLLAWWYLRAACRVRTPVQFACLAATLPVAVHSLVEFPFAYSYFLFPLAWFLGVLCAEQQAVKPLVTERHSRALLACVIGLFALFSAWVGMEYWAAEEDHRVMRFEMRNLGQRPVDYEAPNIVLLDQLGEMLSVARQVPHPGMTAAELQRMRIASDNLAWATMETRYAMALGLNGHPEEASRRLQGLRNFYGETSYAQARQLFIEMRETKYPQLAEVRLP